MDISLRYFMASFFDAQPYSSTIDAALFVVIILFAVITYYIARALLSIVAAIVDKTPTQWDDDILTTKLMKAVSQLAPSITVAILLPPLFPAEGSTIKWIRILTLFYVLWASIRIFIILVNNMYEALAVREEFKLYAVKGIFQTVKLILIAIGVIIGLSILLGKSPVVILTAMGASAAILMLVFKDTIMGLVAGVQLSVNHMLHKGDWIISDAHHANGEVEEVSLTTVKVKNWDNTITTIPPYSLISNSFQNCQPMRESGGRRVMRSIYIDVNSIHFLSNSELDALSEHGLIEKKDVAMQRHHVNLRLLRDYLERYLAKNESVNSNMLYMVRQMEPTPSGLPLQLYFFTHTVEWKAFEHIQANIFDHVYAVINEFGLAVFQTPAGTDLIPIRQDIS